MKQDKGNQTSISRDSRITQQLPIIPTAAPVEAIDDLDDVIVQNSMDDFDDCPTRIYIPISTNRPTRRMRRAATSITAVQPVVTDDEVTAEWKAKS